MKAIVALLIALAVLQASAIDFSDIPQEEIDALEKAVQFKKDAADSQLSKGLFSSLFGSDQQNNKLQFSKTINSKESPEQTQEKADETQKSLSSQMRDIMKNLPYEALLPRRRKSSSPLDLIGSLLKQQGQGQANSDDDDEDESEENPLKELDQLLLGRQRKNRGKKLNWQNPDFKEGKSEIPFTKIFGAKSRGQHGVHVKEEDIQRMLEASMPNLKGGKIIKLSQASYRRGVYLNIEYQTAKEQIYTIKAKYVRRTNELEIISLNEINIMKKVDPESDNDDAVQIEEKPVAKVVEKPKVQEVANVEKKEIVAKTEEKAELAKAKAAEAGSKVVAQEVKQEQPVFNDKAATTIKEESKPAEKPVEAKKPSQLQSESQEESTDQTQQTSQDTESEEQASMPSSETVQPQPQPKPKLIEQN